MPSGSTKSTHGLKLESQVPSSSPGIQEYSWEWGAFPTPSPVRTAFGKGGRVEGWKGKARQIHNMIQKEVLDEDVLAGACGRISAKSGDDSTFVLTADHKSLDFQLSLVLTELPESYPNGKGKEKEATNLPRFADSDEFSKRFEEGKLTFSDFIQDDSLHTNPALIIKWVDGHYITLHDNPSLFDALASWRKNTLQSQSEEIQVEDEESANEMRHARSKSEPPAPEQEVRTATERLEGEATRKPGSLSWVQWWSRTRQRDTGAGLPVPLGERPVLRPIASEPLSVGAVRLVSPLCSL